MKRGEVTGKDKRGKGGMRMKARQQDVMSRALGVMALICYCSAAEQDTSSDAFTLPNIADARPRANQHRRSFPEASLLSSTSVPGLILRWYPDASLGSISVNQRDTGSN